MDDYLKARLKEGNVILFLGAGASWGTANSLKKSPPGGKELARLLAEHVRLSFNSETDKLTEVAAVARRKLGDVAFFNFLDRHYGNCSPSNEQMALSKYSWRRLYTTNIDDSLERALGRGSDQRVRVINRDAPILDHVQGTDDLQLIKLNGCVNSMHAGIIFSVDEYAAEANRASTWYEELARDFGRYTFVFIGTQLDEPLFYHHIKRLMDATGYRNGQSYVVCPEFTDIQRENFSDKNIICCDAKFSDFVFFLRSSLGDGYSTKDIISHNTPGYISLFTSKKDRDLSDLLSEAYALVPVDRKHLDATMPKHRGGLRNFYYGNIPVWRDILDSVPAELDVGEKVRAAIHSGNRLVVLKGAAGCGKSTILMQAALRASSEGIRSFYVNTQEKFPRKALTLLGSNGEEVVAFVDDFEWCHEPIKDMLSGGEARHLRFVVAERANGWARIAHSFKDINAEVVSIERISKNDAKRIIGKLKDYGPWNRLSRLSCQGRINEIYEKSARQLLVGLKEATQGVGFEQIIKDEYYGANGDRERIAINVCAVVTMHRLKLSYGTFDAVMQAVFGRLDCKRTDSLEEIIIDDGHALSLRHAVIADYLVRNVIAKDALFDAINYLLESLARFQSPLRNFAANIEYQIYSSVTNHKFLKSVLGNNECLDIYKRHEKNFEADGLYWLQYATFEYNLGANYHVSALNHIRLAMEAYRGSYQIQHAFANMHFGLAVNASTREEAIALMEAATKILEDQIAERVNDQYPITAIAKGRIGVYRRWMPGQVRTEAKRLVEKLKAAQKNAPLNEVLQSVIYEISLLASVRDELALPE